MTRPGSRKPENGKQREGKKAGSLQRMPDAREIAADILMEVLEKKQYRFMWEKRMQLSAGPKKN